VKFFRANLLADDLWAGFFTVVYLGL
jgi:hypothetical protein